MGHKRAAEASALASNGKESSVAEPKPKARKTNPPKGKDSMSAKSTAATASQSSENPDIFKSYDMKALGIPLEARPQPDKQHGYTVTADNGSASLL